MFIKKIAALLLSAVSMLTAASCSGESGSQDADTVPALDTRLKLTVFDVGKADAMILQTDNTVTVIDTGNKGDGKPMEQFLTDQGIDTIDTLILTHFDKDHVGGATRLVNRLKIGKIYVPDYKSDAEDYLSFVQKARSINMEITQIPMTETVTWSADDTTFTLYAPNETDYGQNEENDFSLGLLAVHGGNKLFFAGDAENPRMKEMIDLGIGKVNFLKFPYHGNYLSGTEDFLDAFSPDITVVCCSEKEYADDRTVETLNNRNIETYYTTDGKVTVVSDGRKLTCTQTKE